MILPGKTLLTNEIAGESSLNDSGVIDEFFDAIFTTIENAPEDLIKQKVVKHYEFFNILKSGEWFLDEYQNEYQSYFLKCSKVDVIELWAKIKAIITKDKNLVNFSKEITSEVKRNIITKIKEYTEEDLIDILTYGIALEKINKLLMERPNLYVKHMERLFNEPHFYLDTFTGNLTHRVKEYSVKVPITRAVDLFKNGEPMNVNTTSKLLSLNILEAVLLDWINGHTCNATAGRVLARHTINEQGKDAIRLSDNKNMILTDLPNTEEWVSLYSTWNLAFCTQLRRCPIIIQKLIIPSVLGFNEANEYLYRRATALYLTMRYINKRIGLANSEEDKAFNWQEESLTELWGMFNKKAAEKYESDVK